MKIYVTGYDGNVGLRLLKYGAFPLKCDVRDEDSVEQAVSATTGATAIVHLAAKTNVDWCEKDGNNDELGKVNLRGTYNVCEVAYKHKIPVVFLSTDHVFRGGMGPYDESSKPFPVNAYGLSKFAAEEIVKLYDEHRIVRTSTLFSDSSDSFMSYMYRIFAGERVRVPVFLRRSFMHVEHFVSSFMVYLQRLDDMPKIVHIAGSKSVSWYKLIKGAAKASGSDKRLVIPRFLEKDGFAPRPRRCGLKTRQGQKLGIPQYSYIDGLALWASQL